jgi:hypothetical protein
MRSPESWRREVPPGLVSEHPLERLERGLGLSALERDLLLLAGLPDEHEGFGSILRVLHPRGEPRPTAGLAAQLFRPELESREEVRAALAAGRLRAAAVVRLEGDAPFFARSLVPAPALWAALHGVDAWPDAVSRRDPTGTRDDPGTWLAGAEARRGRTALEAGGRWTIFVPHRRPGEAVRHAAALVRAAGATPACFALPRKGGGEAERLATLHCLARGAVPVVEVADPGEAAPPRPAPLAEFPGPVVVCGCDGGVHPPAGRRLLELRIEPTAPAQRVEMWRELLPEMDGQAPVLAASYRVEPTAARDAVDDARGQAALAGRAVTADDVTSAIRSRTGARVVEGATLRTPAATWEDLVLPPDRLARLHEAVARVHHQIRVLDEWGFLAGRPGARGVRMLLAGPPGTGKTLSAEVLASALGVELLVADVSRIVSKWIGETEKNLARVFDAAEEAQAVLLFDEADALFARRTEVSDANSRHANLETAYLLTRMERFEGLTVLSTNLRRNVDPAFLRRLEFVVEYEEPGLEERRALWRCHLPERAPLGADVDLEVLARLYPLVGGHVRNAAVAAGFLAAAADEPIRQDHLVRAVRQEYAKSGRPYPGAPPSHS